MSMWLPRLFRRPAEVAPEALEVFLGRQAAFVAQKTVLDYCRVKTGWHERQAFADADFRAALDHCRWQTFAASACDLVAMAEAWLRAYAAGQEAALAEALAALGTRLLAAEEAPPAEREALRMAAEILPRHLAALQDAPPRTADRLRLLAEAPLLATLPVHPDQRVGETPAIRGALRFHLVSSQQEMERLFDPAGLTKRLLAR